MQRDIARGCQCRQDSQRAFIPSAAGFGDFNHSGSPSSYAWNRVCSRETRVVRLPGRIDTGRCCSPRPVHGGKEVMSTGKQGQENGEATGGRAKSKLKILHVTSGLPYPPDSGARVHDFNLLTQVAREHSVFD